MFLLEMQLKERCQVWTRSRSAWWKGRNADLDKLCNQLSSTHSANECSSRKPSKSCRQTISDDDTVCTCLSSVESRFMLLKSWFWRTASTPAAFPTTVKATISHLTRARTARREGKRGPTDCSSAISFSNETVLYYRWISYQVNWLILNSTLTSRSG